jgi:hypothetical protein
MDLANQYVTGKMGLRPGTRDYVEAMDTMLETHGPDYCGVTFDPKTDAALTATEAAKISGLSPQAYNRASQQLSAQKRFSWQKNGK